LTSKVMYGLGRPKRGGAQTLVKSNVFYKDPAEPMLKKRIEKGIDDVYDTLRWGGEKAHKKKREQNHT